MIKLKQSFFLLLFLGIFLSSAFVIWNRFVNPVFIFKKQDPSPISPEVITLQLKWKHQFQFAGYYAAQAQGYYRDAGLEVRIQEAELNLDPAQSVLQGNAEFGISNSELLLLRDRGEPVVALAAIYQHSPLMWLVTQRSGIDNIHNLAGKRVMLEPHATELIAYLAHEGINLNQIIQMPHTFDTMSLIAGKIDAMSAYSTDEPFFLEKSKIEYLTFNPRAGGIDFYGDTLFTTEAQIRNHPKRVQAFVNASLKGWDYALKNPNEIVDLIYNEYSDRHSREHLSFEAKMTRNLILPDVVELGYMNPGRWRYIAEVYQSLGILSKNFSLKGFIYNRNEVNIPLWLYLSLGASLLGSGIISLIFWRFYSFQTRIQKEIQEKLEREKQIRLLEQQYKILVENAPFSVVISALDGKILYMNARAAQQFEISLGYALSLNIKKFYASVSDRPKLLNMIKRQGFVQDYELKLLTSCATEFWASLSVTMTEFEDNPALFTALIDISRRKALSEQLEQLAMTDELTKLYNRRFFIERCTREFKLWQRYKNPFSILLIDIDHFKRINDNFGHDIGDLAIKLVSQSLKQFVREVDVVARYGGEEFVVLLPQTEAAMAQEMAERLRLSIESRELIITDTTINLTVSIGVSEVNAKMMDFNHVLKAVDDALYQAKGNGRNQVCLAAE